MKSMKLAIVLGVLLVLPALAGAAQWDNLLDVAYRFSWYPKSDLQSLLQEKSMEYGSSLETYRDGLIDTLTSGTGPDGRLQQDSLFVGKPLSQYYRLALAEFCLYLANDEMVHLDNAETALSVFPDEDPQGDVAFWKHLLTAYRRMADKDSPGFVASVYSLWENTVLKQEVDNILMDDTRAKVGFVKELPHLYENIAHLVIRRAIIEQEMPNLSSLGTVILSIENKLTLENGYKNLVKAIVERMDGVSSDNYNLNFAVAFLEATANRNDFEAATEPDELVAKFNAARKFYQLAYYWADTNKGRATIMGQYMGFLTYVTRRMIDPNDPVATTRFFEKLPGMAVAYLDKGIELFDLLALHAAPNGNFTADGYYKRGNYLISMHRLWDATGKLSIMLADYYKSRRKAYEIETLFPVESPLLKYCALFQRHARIDQDIVPDNAYFLAAYAARELADLYQQLSEYSTGVEAKALFFAYQLQAVELFPADVTSILQLAYQSNLDGRVEDYFRYITPIAARLEQSKVVDMWLANHNTPFNPMVAHLGKEIPAIMLNAYTYLNVIRESEGTEDGFYRKAIILEKIFDARDSDNTDVDRVMKAVGKEDLSNARPLTLLFEEPLSEPFNSRVASILNSAEMYPVTRLKNKLYGALDGSEHGFLRALFYEIPFEEHQYVQLIRALRQP
ncbi:hypothetical protein Pcar_1652 [Syntrophotalea carbinolica DSM 2380]|uniref:Uncharacterized protein n=1 Tax=Syntrophotalea carbinolica (strain DSM 2380 / NBRC 103641 / GraBd1) TaxID=338963 RepID=Q3A411_SYNC1|nr:hypothetical protein [Syntrophotalea carbinolica]ABA88896.1 hypothetical protein Pcar_1652 [Syntrophotalea carbinolica DSM 2380]